MGGEPFTDFVLISNAFAVLPDGTLEGLSVDTKALSGVLLYHVVDSAVKAADAAELAAAAEINQLVFEEAEDFQPTSNTWAYAQAFASMNNGYLAQ